MKRPIAITALFFAVAAPVAGDLGSCGQEIAQLDPLKFYSEREFIDCTKCEECGFVSETCVESCNAQLEVSEFDEGCFPLVHDGEVCLNALRAAGCDEYTAYIDDLAPEVPTECNFCPIDRKPEAPE